jgi:hypothetical protein
MKMDDIIAAACEELNTSYENNALWFEVLINQAIRSHKTTHKLILKTVELTLADNKATIPSDFTKLVRVYFCGGQVNEYYCPDIDYTIQGDVLIFYKALDDNTKVQLEYYGLNTDADGVFIIPNDWERMLVAYIGWKYTRRYAKDFGVAIMQNYQREYQTQKLANI